MTIPLISLALCTYNRCDVLSLCLESLVKQTADHGMFEVLVIDNNSSDDTKKVANQYNPFFKNFRYIIEKQQGLSFARNRAFAEAKGEYVAYIDDDAKAKPDWIEEIIKFIEKYHPPAFGGPCKPFYLEKKPIWYKDEYGSMNLGDKVKVLGEDEWISGNNMVFNKKILFDYNGFNTKIGMNGKKISYGEETNLLVRLKEDFINIYYLPSIEIEHLVPGYKLNLGWFIKSGYYNGISSVITFNIDNKIIGAFRVFKSILIKAIIDFFRSKEKYIQNRFIDSFSDAFYYFGIFIGTIRK